jgi:Domain of unknown function (DUF222)
VRLSELCQAMRSYASRFDADRISAADAARVVEDATAIENMAASVKACAASRVAETEVWKRDGDRSAAHQLARTTGTSIGHAKETLQAARRLHNLPATQAAARRGELSFQQVAVIADAASTNPNAEAQLVAEARTRSLGELREECARAKASACDLEERRRRIHEQRCLRTYTDAEGAGNLHLRDNPEVVAEVMAAVEPIRGELFHAARKEGRREPLEAYAADAMVELVRRANGTNPAKRRCDTRAKILVRVDFDALLRGAPIGGEICELAGYGPIAVSAVHEMVDTADPSSPRLRPRVKQ